MVIHVNVVHRIVKVILEQHILDNITLIFLQMQLQPSYLMPHIIVMLLEFKSNTIMATSLIQVILIQMNLIATEISLYDLINNLLVDELSLEQLSDFIDPTNTKYVITDQEILDISDTDLYKLVHFNDTNLEHYMDIAYYDSGYDLTYVGYVLLDSSACE